VSEPLYTLDILRLAAESSAFTRLIAPDVSATQRSALCGSHVVIDLALSDGIVTATGGEVRACAFGQASTTLFARSAIGKSSREIEVARGAVRAWLDKADAPAPRWPGIEVLAPARAKPARHVAILLPFDAALAALTKIATPA